jgi:TRAP-type C4-dicarboxylate transport system substrate-binding protein
MNLRQFAALVVAASALIGAAPAGADPAYVLRMATAAPEGTAWARLLRSFGRDVETATAGQVRMKWYLGGVAGDELQMGERVKKGQLDGVASGGPLCTRLAPSMRVLGLVGLFQSRGEAAYVMGRLKPTLDEEFQQSGFSYLGELTVGPIVLFTRRPVESLTELRRTPMWIWNLDDVLGAETQQLGLRTVPLSVERAARAYDDATVDGFLAVPAAALAFQWSTQARYVTDLHAAVLNGCMIIANRAFDPLPLEAQRAVRTAVARVVVQLDDVGRAQDEALLDGLFARQGLKVLRANDTFRSEFFEAARVGRERLGQKLVPEQLLLRVTSWLADFRAEHPTPRPAR